MSKYRKKPVVIDAVQFTAKGIPNAPEWIGTADQDVPWGEPGSIVRNFRENTLAIHTLEGAMTANVGDWIIRGVQGELYPCKPDIFAATYEPVGDEVSS